MKLKAYSLYDAKAKAFLPPHFYTNTGMALRQFSDLCNENTSVVYRHPEDYVLYYVGDYDDEDAKYIQKTPLEVVGTALEYRQAEKIDLGKMIEISKNNNLVEAK